MTGTRQLDDHEAFAFELLRQGHPETARALAKELRRRPGFLRMVRNFRRIEERAIRKVRVKP